MDRIFIGGGSGCSANRSGGREERHLKIKVNLDLTKPLHSGTNLKYKGVEQ